MIKMESFFMFDYLLVKLLTIRPTLMNVIFLVSYRTIDCYSEPYKNNYN